MIRTHSASIVVDAQLTQQQYCAYEHLAQFDAAKPPEVVFVSVTKLIDVYRLIEGNRNSEWTRIFGKGGNIMVRIIATSDSRVDMIRYAAEHMKKMDETPRCNLYGVNLRGSARRILCSNGKAYDSQLEAAKSLGLSASAISRHMRNELKTVGGFTFAYEAK